MIQGKRLVWDVTTVVRWGNAHAVGIVRVEKNYLYACLSEFSDNIELCRYDSGKKAFFGVDKTVVLSLVVDENKRGKSEFSDVNIIPAWKLKLKYKNFKKKVVRRIKKHSKLYSNIVILEKKIAGFFKPKKEEHVEPEFIFLKNDVYITMGLDWDYDGKMKALYEKKNKHTIKVIVMCYDIISILFPQYTPKGFSQIFTRYMVDAMWCADHVFCISKKTKEDIAQFCNDLFINAPTFEVIRLGSSIKKPSSAIIPSNATFLDEKKFVLFVSSIEGRKNHMLLYYVWSYLAEKYTDIPNLVFVGMKGWLVDDLLYSINANPELKDKINLLHGVSDEELMWLYQNCLFTVFPSFYEGWGLPVAESLSYGKFCICSDRGSLPEVGADLVEYLDPYDTTAWSKRIKELSDDVSLISQRESEILKRYNIYSWEESAKTFIISLRRKIND